MEKVKMDKVRRLLGNRYTEEGRVAVMKILGNVVNMQECEGANIQPSTDMTADEFKLGMKALTDLVTRASKEPTIKEVEDSEE